LTIVEKKSIEVIGLASEDEKKATSEKEAPIEVSKSVAIETSITPKPVVGGFGNFRRGKPVSPCISQTDSIDTLFRP